MVTIDHSGDRIRVFSDRPLSAKEIMEMWQEDSRDTRKAHDHMLSIIATHIKNGRLDYVQELFNDLGIKPLA